MALSGQLGAANLTASSIETSATLTSGEARLRLDNHDRPSRRCRTRAGADNAAFQKAAENAKSGCPVSKLLKANITMTAKLEG